MKKCPWVWVKKKKKLEKALAVVAQLVGVSSRKPEGHGFDSGLEDIPMLWVHPWLVHVGGSLALMFLSLPSFPSL